jgi:hypothetical protein
MGSSHVDDSEHSLMSLQQDIDIKAWLETIMDDKVVIANQTNLSINNCVPKPPVEPLQRDPRYDDQRKKTHAQRLLSFKGQVRKNRSSQWYQHEVR